MRNFHIESSLAGFAIFKFNKNFLQVFQFLTNSRRIDEIWKKVPRVTLSLLYRPGQTFRAVIPPSLK